MNQQFVTSIEGFIAADTACPEASEVLSFPLVNVSLFYVSDQFVLLVVSGTAVNPLTDLLATAELLLVAVAGLQGLGRHGGTEVRQCPRGLAELLVEVVRGRQPLVMAKKISSGGVIVSWLLF